MKKIHILTMIFAVGISSPAFPQSFLDRALKKVDKTLNAADEFLSGKPAEAQETQSTDTKPAAQTTQPGQTTGQTPFWLKTDAEKLNLKGGVKTIVETEIWDVAKYVSTYSYNEYGALEEYTCEDGSVKCTYSIIDGAARLASRQVTIGDRDYASVSWDGKGYMEPETRDFFADEEGRPSRETTAREQVTYTYLDGAKVVRADIEREGAEMLPSFYVYDASGNLVFEYMENMKSQPIREIKYDAQGRKVYEKEIAGPVSEYRYNDHNDVVSRKVTNTFGDDEDSESAFTYRYDDRGNWTEKEWKSNGETVATYKRTIEYYK